MPSSRFGCLIAALLLCTTCFAGPVALAPRDWARFPAILQRTTTEDVFAVGDVHGDYDRLVSLLVANHIIASTPARPEQVKWTAGRALLICTGDLIDRWPQGISVIRLFRALQAQARQAQGEVIVTMGNHEAEFLSTGGDHRRTQEFEHELQQAGLDPEAIRSGRDVEGLGEFLRSLPILAVINDWCFVHAGNFQGRSLDQLRTALETGISQHGFDAAILSDPDGLLEARLQPNPWWETGTLDALQAEAHLRSTVRALGCEHLVTGHQPKAAYFIDGTNRRSGELSAEFGGLLFLIDTGMSRGIGLSQGALLCIRPKLGTASVLSAQGRQKQLWRESSSGKADAIAAQENRRSESSN